MVLSFVFYYLILPVFLIWYLIRLTYRPCRSKVLMVGKTAVITGGSRGIGFQTALGLAARGCKVIVGCRSKAEKRRNDIIKMTHNPNVIFKHLDLNSLASVRKFAAEIKSTEKKIDVLINSAGIAVAEKYTSPDNLNSVMQTNFFGHFLLTHLLVDLLKKSENGRIIFLSSNFTLFNNLSLDTLNVLNEESQQSLGAGIVMYGNSKTCQLIASNLFSEKLNKFGITSNAVHPGAVYSDIFETVHIKRQLLSIFYLIGFFLFKSTEEGAQPVLRLAISNTYKNISGTFAWDFRHHPAPKCSKKREFCQQIWDASEKLIKLSENEKI